MIGKIGQFFESLPERIEVRQLRADMQRKAARPQ